MPTRSPSSPSPSPRPPPPLGLMRSGWKAQGDGGGSIGTPKSVTGTVAPMPDHPMNERIEELAARKEQARKAGSPRAVQRQHDRGKMTARERVEYLLDEGSFQELDMLGRHRVGEAVPERPYTDGIITGFGTIDGRRVCVFSQDFTVFGGALGEVFAEKVHKVMDLASSLGVPVVGLNDGAGARIQEGVGSLAMYGGIFYRNVLASGVVPQISVIMGPCAGGAVYSPALTDFVFMVRETSYMFITGPDVVKTVTNEVVTAEELGGAAVHTTKSGIADGSYENDVECLLQMRRLLDFLPANNEAGVPEWPSHDDIEHEEKSLDTLVPDNPYKPYDIKELVLKVADEGDFF